MPTIEEWVSSELGQGDVAAANPFVFSIGKMLIYTCQKVHIAYIPFPLNFTERYACLRCNSAVIKDSIYSFYPIANAM